MDKLDKLVEQIKNASGNEDLIRDILSKLLPKETNDKGLFKRGDSPFWWYKFTINGKPYSASTQTENKKLAKMIMDKKRTEVIEGKHLDKKSVAKMTFQELSDKFMVWAKERKKCWKKMYLTNLVRINQALGDKLIEDIDRKTVKAYLTSLEKDKLAFSTINKHKSTIGAIFAWAMDDEQGYTEFNPARGIKNLEEDNEVVRYLTEAEYALFMAANKGDQDAVDLLHFFLNTGMRPGEPSKLDMEKDVDYKLNIITLPAKHSKSRKKRVIPMNDIVVDILKRNPDVFKLNVGKKLERSFKKAGIKDFTPHCLRHTFATNYLDSGGKLEVLRDILGHHSVKVTERYAHVKNAPKVHAVNLVQNYYLTPRDISATNLLRSGSEEENNNPNTVISPYISRV